MIKQSTYSLTVLYISLRFLCDLHRGEAPERLGSPGDPSPWRHGRASPAAGGPGPGRRGVFLASPKKTVRMARMG